MNSNTFLRRFGLNPNDFKPSIADPIKTDTGYLYLLEQQVNKSSCPYCSSLDIVIKDYYYKEINCSETALIHDIFRIKMCRLKCKSCCKTFTNKLSNIQPYASISNNTKRMICADFLSSKSFSEIADCYHTTTANIIHIFDENISDVSRLVLPEVLCIDEFYFSSSHNCKYCVILVDWKSKQIIDILPNRQLNVLRSYFSEIPLNERKKVKYFVSDLYDGYRSICREFFHHATHIADFFHITVQLTYAVSVTRTMVMKQLPTDSIEYKFMKKYWKLFECHSNKIPQSKTFKTKSALEESIYLLFFRCVKLNPNLLIAYSALQSLFSFQKDQYFQSAYDNFLWLANQLKSASFQKVIDVGNTYSKWIIEIANAYSLHKGYKNISNSIAESTNNHIASLIKVAYGFSNFSRFRKRVLLLLRTKKGDHF